MSSKSIPVNNVNESAQQLDRVAFGRGGNRTSKVVNKRNPCRHQQKQRQQQQQQQEQQQQQRQQRQQQQKEEEESRQDKKANEIRIGTWNVRTLRRPGKLAGVIGEMRKAKLNILGLSEVRWKETGDFISDGFRVIYSGGDSGVQPPPNIYWRINPPKFLTMKYAVCIF